MYLYNELSNRDENPLGKHNGTLQESSHTGDCIPRCCRHTRYYLKYRTDEKKPELDQSRNFNYFFELRFCFLDLASNCRFSQNKTFFCYYYHYYYYYYHYLLRFALIVSAHQYCARNSRGNVMPSHALSARAVEKM